MKASIVGTKDLEKGLSNGNKLAIVGKRLENFYNLYKNTLSGEILTQRKFGAIDAK